MALKTLMVPVDSSALKSVGYDRGTLWVEFHHSGLYEYQNVPPATYHRLLFNTSKGKYFDRHIRGRYKTRKIH
jgi:hypothetical protein